MANMQQYLLRVGRLRYVMGVIGEVDKNDLYENINFEDISAQKVDFKDAKAVIDELLWISDDICKDNEFFFLTNLFFSILTYSDKSDVIFGKSASEIFPENMNDAIDFYKEMEK